MSRLSMMNDNPLKEANRQAKQKLGLLMSSRSTNNERYILMEFNDILDIVLHHEGGLVDHPDDPGGLTNMGISKRGHPELLDSEIRNMTRKRAAEIYRQSYWMPIRGAELPSTVALVVFDSAVNSGVRRASRWLQQAVGVAADGVIGPQTLSAVSSRDAGFVACEILAVRMMFYTQLKTWPKFGLGWTRRIIDIARYCEQNSKRRNVVQRGPMS